MKKLFLTLMLALGIGTAMAQDIKLPAPPRTIEVTAITVRSATDWRTGLALSILPLRDSKGHVFANLDVWALTNTERWNRTYLGLGLRVPVWHSHQVTLSVVGGWSADFSRLRHINNGAWSVGVALGIRF